MINSASYYRKLRNKNIVRAVLFIIFSFIAFFVSDYTSCNAGHLFNDTDCNLQPQTLSETWSAVAWIAIVATIASLAIALTASFTGHQRKKRSYAGIIRVLIMIALLLILAVPLLYHLSFQVPYNPWDHSKNLLYYLLLYGSVFILPGLALAAVVAAISLWFIGSPKDPGIT